MTSHNNTAVMPIDSGLKRKAAIVEAGDSRLVSPSISDFNMKHSIFLAAKTITLGIQPKTYVAAIYCREGLMRDVSKTLTPYIRHDATQHNMHILNQYASGFPGVEKIYFTLDDLGFILAADNGVRTEKLYIQQNPIGTLLEEKMAKVMENLRNNRGL